MEEDNSKTYLKQFRLSKVEPTGIRIGVGTSTEVKEVLIPVVGAAKMILEPLKNLSEPSNSKKAQARLEKECKLMRDLRHPHIVQFLGVYFPDPRYPEQPALVMERMLTSLHDLLSPRSSPTPLSLFTLDLKCSVLKDVANGLAYLHEQSESIIHRNMSAKNVLLNSDMVAKISDLRQARIVPIMKPDFPMTVSPGDSLYMPPEATKEDYDASIDIFSFGIIIMFTIGDTLPCDLKPATYYKKDVFTPRTELDRRSKYMDAVRATLQGDHPLIQLIQQCLCNDPRQRPKIRKVLDLLEKARAGIRDGNTEEKRRELVRALQKTQPTEQNLQGVIQDLVAKNADLEKKNGDLEKENAGLTDLKRTLEQKEEQLEEMKAKLAEFMETNTQQQQIEGPSCEGEHKLKKRQKETGQAAISSTNILREKPDTRHICMITYSEGSKEKIYRPINDISTAWEPIAQQLKVDDSKIQNEKKNQDAITSATEMIRIWLGSDPKASWFKLIKAMKVKRELENAAKELETALQNKVESDDEGC